jgi:hypothetical protein
MMMSFDQDHLILNRETKGKRTIRLFLMFLKVEAK